jgi:hypothetical protein
MELAWKLIHQRAQSGAADQDRSMFAASVEDAARMRTRQSR